MITAFIIFSCFVGLALVAATVMTGVMIAVGRWTLPNSPERRVKEAQADEQIAQLKHSTILTEEKIDAMVSDRYRRAIEKGSSS